MNRTSLVALSGLSLIMIASLAAQRWLSTSSAAALGAVASSKLSVVMVSVPSAEVGKVIARALVEEKLAACVQIVGGVESVYFWEGKVQSDQENLLFIKTKSSLIPHMTERVLSLHPYDTPEVISLPIESGSDKYLKWVVDTTK